METVNEKDVESGLQSGSAGSANGQGSARLEQPPVRQSTFKSVSQSIQSRASRVASLTGRLAARFSFNRPGSGEPKPSLSQADITARDEFLAVILHQDGVTLSPADLSERHVEWYSKFLECRFKGAWTVIREALSTLPPTLNEPQEGDLATVYNFMSMVAKMLLQKESKRLALSQIYDKAFNEKRWKDKSDGQRIIPTQLVFQAVGWLTMLYDPEPFQRPDDLCIRKAQGSIPRQRTRTPRQRTRTRPGRVFTNYTQDIEGSEQPLYLCLRKFGKIIPAFEEYPNNTPLISVSHVCYSILDKVAGVELEWVNSLSQHLEFDNFRRRLKIFRFPSFCMLMYRDLTSISNIYLDYKKIQPGNMRPEQDEDLSPEYFREVLLSYRLIFGQHKDSWKTFKSKIPALPERWACSDKHSDDADPLLSILCSESYDSPEAQKIYEYIDASEELSPYYYPDSDFPFLGRRILDLQAFVGGRNPHNWKGLWNDRRNIALWWTFWAVIIIGGSTIILQFIQTIFQIWGGVLAYYQVGTSNSCPMSCP